MTHAWHGLPDARKEGELAWVSETARATLFCVQKTARRHRNCYNVGPVELGPTPSLRSQLVQSGQTQGMVRVAARASSNQGAAMLVGRISIGQPAVAGGGGGAGRAAPRSLYSHRLRR